MSAYVSLHISTSSLFHSGDLQQFCIFLLSDVEGQVGSIRILWEQNCPGIYTVDTCRYPVCLLYFDKSSTLTTGERCFAHLCAKLVTQGGSFSRRSLLDEATQKSWVKSWVDWSKNSKPTSSTNLSQSVTLWKSVLWVDHENDWKRLVDPSGWKDCGGILEYLLL